MTRMVHKIKSFVSSETAILKLSKLRSNWEGQTFLIVMFWKSCGMDPKLGCLLDILKYVPNGYEINFIPKFY